MAIIKSISGIRGTIGGKSGDALTPIEIVKYTAAFATFLKRKNPNLTKIVIGRDARLSGEFISKIVVGTIQSLGINVIDLGLSTTPTVEIAVPEENALGGIILTASHNPINWNALKLLNGLGEFISDEEGKEVLEIAENEDFTFCNVNEIGSYKFDNSYITKHIEKILELPLVDKKAISDKKFSIIIDAVNSSGGIAVPLLLEALGVKNIAKLNCEPTGIFAHNPEPLPENLTEIIEQISKEKYDLGIVVDPDVDRLAFICDDGSPFGEEYTLVSIADYVLKNTPGNTVSNLSSTRALKEVTEKLSCSYAAAAVGEVNVVKLMKNTNAIIGGEGNGGIIYPESHYGRDALVGIALFLTYLAKSGKSSSSLRKTYPNYHISKNKIELTINIDVDSVLKYIERKYSEQPMNTIDGLKIEFGKEWVHLRKSNTEPIIRIYSESDSEYAANVLAEKIINDIKEFI